jgi:hypothetical protein
MKKQNKKIKISIIISVISIMIALSSLSFTIYKDLRDYGYEKELRELEINSMSFSETYDKINFAEKNIIDNIDSCKYEDEINKESVKNNLDMIIKSRQAMIDNDNSKALSYLSLIKDVCVKEETIIPRNMEKTMEMTVIVIIWIILLISFIIVNNKEKRK